MGKYPKYLKAHTEYGRWTVVHADANRNVMNGVIIKPSRWYYVCKCACGTIRSVNRHDMVSGGTVSCGCYKSEMASVRMSKVMHKTNLIEDCGEYTKVLFFNTAKYALVDKEDYEKIKAYCWYYNDGYVKANYRKGHPRINKLHRLIMSAEKNIQVDHINGDTLDNRKDNLRLCTGAQNVRNTHKLNSNNTSGYKGVFYDNTYNKWIATFMYKGKKKMLGYFNTAKEGAIAYDRKVRTITDPFLTCNLDLGLLSEKDLKEEVGNGYS